VTFDCITCDKCIPVCPNDANFSYHTGEVRLTYRDLEVRPDGSVLPVGEEREFAVEQAEQIANFADYCNHCGNCDTFCPEYDGPYLKKPNFYGSRTAFEAGAPHDGFFVEGKIGTLTMDARIQGSVYKLTELPEGGRQFDDGQVTLSIGPHGIKLAPQTPPPSAPHRVDMGRLYMLVTLLGGISNSSRVHAVNTRLLAVYGESANR
jgi:putative selenate reductase